MKYLFLFIFLCSLSAYSQTKDDSIRTAGVIANWYALDFTVAERDSLLNGLKELGALYAKMHELPTPNSLTYPFAFRPTPAGMKIPDQQEKISWNIPSNVRLPADRNELAFYSIPQLASLIKSKKISSVDLTRFFLDRLKKYGDTLHCVISLTEDIAMQQAEQADKEIASGKYKGPLHGIPYGLKDLFSVKGTKTTWGTTPYKDQSLDEDAFVYTQLKKAGAVLCAKLSLGALAYNDLWFGGRTNNPWNMKQGSSGSSAGSAAATAAGLLPFAIGTETWGSIVSPSNRCGTTGLRPTFGSVSRSGAMVLSWSLDKAGPICRSAEDAAIVFYYLKGTDGKDASAVERSFNYTGKVNWKKIRVAYAANYFKALPADAQQWNVLETFRKLGANVEEVQFPDSTIYPVDIMNPIINAESAAAFDELTRSNRDDLIERQDKDFWPNGFRTSRFIPAVEYINANRHRYTLIDTLNKFMKQYDVVIVPSFSGNQLAMTNLTGHPVVVFPIGFSENGSPISITLIGNLYDEATILAVAKAYQDATPYNKKHPPYFSAAEAH
jgi:Asp-tRNA(Asn)/Glu-tRNA(Gln) amidotransferase A subunit family amidase